MEGAFSLHLGLLLGILSVPAAAIDPGVVKGELIRNGKVQALKYVYAWQPPGQAEEWWVYLSDTEAPSATDPFRGVKLIVHPTRPDLKSLRGVLHSGGSPTPFKVTGSVPRWRRLLAGNRRVVGRITYSSEAWSLDVEFSAPVFGVTETRP